MSCAAIKLFYWMRLAYRHSDALTNLYVNAHTGLRLFSVDHFGGWGGTGPCHVLDAAAAASGEC